MSGHALLYHRHTDVPVARIGNFFIQAENVSDENCYIQQATWNGKPYTKNYITHEMIKGGGILKFVMGPKPNKAWGADEEDRPKSNINNL